MTNLGGFSEEALLLFQLAASERAYDFSEEGEVYDFTRCMRPNGTYYGTRGQCKSGSQSGPAEVKEKGAPKAPKPRAQKSIKAAKGELALVKAATKGDKSPESKQRLLNAKNQLRDAHRQSSDKAKAAARTMKEAEKNYRSVEKELKKDPKNKELRARYKEAIKAANAAERELMRADRENDKAARARGRQYDKEQRAMMTPAQRKADRELRQRMKELG
jgi:hypothetical protein